LDLRQAKREAALAGTELPGLGLPGRRLAAHEAYRVLGHETSGGAGSRTELRSETHLWGLSELWIAEGLAAYVFEPGEVDSQFRQLLDSGKAVPLNWLVNPGWTASSVFPPTAIHPELVSFVKYLKKTYGAARLRQVWQGGCAAIPRVLDKSLGISRGSLVPG